MTEEQRKVWLIAEFLGELFVDCPVSYDSDDKVAGSYRIVHSTTGELLHDLCVTRAFLDDHVEADIVPALQRLDILVYLMIAGRRRVTVRKQTVEIEPGGC